MTWDEEIALIVPTAMAHGVDPLFIAAIRKAENGREGREFGVLAIPAHDYDTQLSITCKTVRNILANFSQNPFKLQQAARGIRRCVYTANFIAAFATKWAPPNSENDPRGLNKFWFTNASTWYGTFVEHGL
jgi:hypothetical protein